MPGASVGVAPHGILGSQEDLEVDVGADPPAAQGPHQVVRDDDGRGGVRGEHEDAGPAARHVRDSGRLSRKARIDPRKR